MKFRSILTYTASLLLVMLSAACNHEEMLPVEEEAPAMVNLVLRMAVNPGKTGAASGLKSVAGAKATRADDYTYEGPSDIYEGVRSLRVIIVRQIIEDAAGAGEADGTISNIIEHNSYYLFPDNNTIWDNEQTYVYKVAGGEKKRIYLIGNEASVGEDFVNLVKGYEEGDAVQLDLLDNYELSSGNGVPFIDNTHGEGKWFIPMTEIFEAEIPARGMNQDLEYRLDNSLFLTRVLSKFEFSVDVDKSASDYGINGMKITSITVSGKNEGDGCLADLSWLFPHGYTSADGDVQIAGGAEYTPDKYGPSTEKLNGKAITNFSVSTEAKTYDFEFTPEKFGIPGKKDNTDLSNSYMPLDYFLESGAKEFYVTVTAESNGLVRTYGPKKLPNLPFFARNTNAKILFSFSGYDMNATVVLVPYLGVSLNPWFGFE